jgi:hypothetical protein
MVQCAKGIHVACLLGLAALAMPVAPAYGQGRSRGIWPGMPARQSARDARTIAPVRSFSRPSHFGSGSFGGRRFDRPQERFSRRSSFRRFDRFDDRFSWRFDSSPFLGYPFGFSPFWSGRFGFNPFLGGPIGFWPFLGSPFGFNPFFGL